MGSFGSQRTVVEAPFDDDPVDHDREGSPRPAPARRAPRRRLALARGRTSDDAVCAVFRGVCTDLAMTCAAALPTRALTLGRRARRHERRGSP
jgi:hypothetical protein